MRMRILCIACVSLMILSGCAWFKVKEEKTAQELAGDGMEAMQTGKYANALESFEKIRDWYPFSKFAILAELKIADAHYHLKQYEEAIFAYEEFENLHPRNEAIPYVIYQIGRCYFEQIDTIDRDQTPAQKGLDIFNRLLKQFPDAEFADRARDHAKSCIKNIAGHEFYVGLFYYKGKHYKAALSRFQTIISNYPDVGIHHKALQYVTLCEASLSENIEK